MHLPFKWPRSLVFILLVGLFLRLAFALTAPLELAQLSGGDTVWYLANGVALLSGETIGIAFGLPYDVSVLPTAPLYLLFVGFWARLLPLGAALVTIRLLQVLLSVATCFFAYDIARRLGDDERVGIVAVAVLAFSPAFILEPRNVLTETLYIFAIVGGIWAFVRATGTSIDGRWLVLSGVLLALATLTRAVSLLYPLGLVGLLLLTHFRQNWRQALLAGVALLLPYIATVSTWTIHNALAYQRFVIGSDQLMPAVWRGAVENDASPQHNDALLGEDTYTEQATDIIWQDPTGYAQRRSKELLRSYLQPHGTVHLGNESLKAMVGDWVQSGFSLDGLWRLVRGEGFWPKLLIYFWHYSGLVLGVIGMWLTRRRWPVSLTLIGFIAYTTLLHLVVLALPRYIFPAMMAYWIFAAVTLVQAWDGFSAYRAKKRRYNGYSE